MKDKIVYLIFGLSLAIFICVYMFVPTLKNKYEMGINDDMGPQEEFAPIYTGLDGIREEAIKEMYKGNVILEKVFTELKYVFISYNKEVFDSNLSFEDYYKQNTELVEQRYGCKNEKEFVELFNSFKELEKDVYAVSIVTTSIGNDDLLELLLAVKNSEDVAINAKYYVCKIYNNEVKKGCMYKLEPYQYNDLEVEQ